ncbi:2OG-Fe(II) oxygenase [Cordyceps fumosorosea ARSEF 2679]|uniref:2OG-Fe(II) oxygenase n=1 Tax=Cordyceps fumosorosea (strain ARSEF 2679) TaxID=1081104 RepID=A0A162JL39_CORFA|nr:2OG-Fe(II) oxygenase [Cordyceps fumosorosea ARSEF 2679]OAA70562.1 2OG-Fe(II) oxygenase [Cordyceps fumosorosea ARSEF 2679]
MMVLAPASGIDFSMSNNKVRSQECANCLAMMTGGLCMRFRETWGSITPTPPKDYNDNLVYIIPHCSPRAAVEHCAIEDDLVQLSTRLHEVFATVGFAYLINAPLSFDHDAVFGMAMDFFRLPEETKMSVAKKTFRKANANTYRWQSGFELGPSHRLPASSRPSSSPFILTEPNCFPSSPQFTSREASRDPVRGALLPVQHAPRAARLVARGKNPASFTSILRNSVSTLRLLRYSRPRRAQHIDATGGLEARNAEGAWIPAPYVPGSVVVNVGDLLARMSGRWFVATMHRVRSTSKERFSMPFFSEPGVDAMVGERGREVRYEEFVLNKMGTWVEFQDEMEKTEIMSTVSASSEVHAY